ncbi:MAG: HAD family phosphatase [Halobacteriovoraceae bacterium]|nr:HAD family phosphatase [Halobacteriovoraceae bacterium]MCB9095190.1 HAD family phosphatase [Halobacteriovoraceae bacterium]
MNSPKNKIKKTWTHIPTVTEIFKEFPDAKHILFDLDGTLLDSEAFHMEAIWRLAGSMFGLNKSLSDVWRDCYGRSDDNSFELLKKESGRVDVDLDIFLSTKNVSCSESFFERLQKGTLFENKIMELLQDLSAKKTSMGIVTASERHFLDLVLGNLGVNKFNVTVARGETPKSKPHPEPYLKAMETLQVKDPTEVLIFEDSPTGIAAALSSGAIVNRVQWFNNSEQ